MKIELTCPQCQSVLRLDAEHAGKLALCPVCSELVEIPDAEAPADSGQFGNAPSAGRSVWGDTRNPFGEGMASQPLGTGGSIIERDAESPTVGNTNPFASPRSNSTSYQPAAAANAQRQDEMWGAGVVLGCASIFVQCMCCSLGVVLALPMSSVGLFCTFLSKSPNRWIGFVLNLIAMAMSLVIIVGFVLSLISAMN